MACGHVSNERPSESLSALESALAFVPPGKEADLSRWGRPRLPR
jgi:hypothetical protein